METVLAAVTTVVPNDVIRFPEDEKFREVVMPHPDVIRPMKDGKPVKDTSGKIVKIVHERSWLESCTDSSMVHLHTDRGIVCIHRETLIVRQVD